MRRNKKYFFKKACKKGKEYYFCTPVLEEAGAIKKRLRFALIKNGEEFIDIMKHSQEKEQQGNPLSI